MKEIASRLHENRQIELAKSILENAGYTVTKKIEEDTSAGIISRYVSQLAAKGDLYTLASQKEIFLNDEDRKAYYESNNSLMLDAVAKILGTSPDKIYYVCSEDFEDESSYNIFRELGKLESVRISSKEVYGEERYWARIITKKLESTGETFIYVFEQDDEEGLYEYYYFK